MLDFFSIFTKGGLVLWYFQAECLKINLQEAINEFIRYSIIDKNSGVFHHNKMKLEHAMDNEFELVFVVGYQNFLKVSYIGKSFRPKWGASSRWSFGPDPACG